MKKRITTIIEITALITEDMIRKEFNLPSDAKITFHVPGGGDYSNLTLPLGESKHGGLEAVWTHTEVQEEPEE